MTGTRGRGIPVAVPGRVRLALVVFGLAASAAGVVAMYRGEDGAASAATITMGVALIVLGLLTPYFQSFKAGGVEIELLHQVDEAANSIKRAGSRVDEMTRILTRSRKLELEITLRNFSNTLTADERDQLLRDIHDLQTILDETESNA